MYKFKQKILKNRLPQIKGAMQKAAAALANNTAEEICEIAKQLAPYDEKHKGDEPHLRDTIHTESYADNSMAKNVVVDSNHGVYVEFGTHKMEAQPFLRPAAESVKARRDEQVKQLAADFEKQINGG